MATKSYTDISQSKRLAEILPIESADMTYIGSVLIPYPYCESKFIKEDDVYPAWSLAVLLDILDYPQLSKDKLGSGKTGWMVSVYPDNCRYDSCWHDNPVDACYELILKLHNLKCCDYD